MRHYGGLIMGYPVHLKFASMEKQFTSNPENVTARRGQPVALSCVISSAPAAELLWLRNEEALPDGDRYHTLSSQLLITDVTSADAGEYRCIATNPQLNKTRTSRSGHLQVTVHAEDQEPSFLPVYVEQNIAVARGSRVILPCPVTGWPRPKLIWEQSLPGGKTAELEVTDEVFVIHSLEYDQEGTYTCSVVGHSELTKTFNVTITEPPEITIPPAGKEVLRASTVRFNCTASGRPEPNISWYKNWTLLTMAGRINLRKSADGQRNELVISGVTSDDAGVYQCFAQNVAGVASAWAILNVTGEDAAAPTNVRCWPISDRKVAVKWDSPTVGEVIAYTVHGTLQSKTGLNVPAKPVTDTEENITVDASLTPYRFQIRSYMHPKSPSKNVASDPSAAAVCQGQGVPIKMAKLEDGKILVSWKQFYEDNPGVVQWILQHRLQDTSDERNITLDGSVYNYTLPASSNGPQQIRVLGSRSLKWLRQDLSLVPWVSTASAGRDLEAG
ncbi:peroxidasin-like [Hyposmocoma kahamanoa]|uniref:peroxidasin-like n=1 Tax=Hyposmocoma kahamanoa TaxID=1477025 RepID=UPI000E6D6F95|nr:peroxidasin-like [Hyposmocoma kahamanoa]